MNVFYLNDDPVKCAQEHLDKHVVKMILEYAQLLCTAHRLLDGSEYEGKTKTGRRARRWLIEDNREENLYMASHMHHPSGIWARESAANYNWLLVLWLELMKEYTYRYKKHHVAERLIPFLTRRPANITYGDRTEIPQCMPEEYKVAGNSIQAYHNYYVNDKQRFARWTNRPVPTWYVNQILSIHKGKLAKIEVPKLNVVRNFVEVTNA